VVSGERKCSDKIEKCTLIVKKQTANSHGLNVWKEGTVDGHRQTKLHEIKNQIQEGQE
jgi:hypothetical protein